MRAVIVVCCLLLVPIATFVAVQESSSCPPLGEAGVPIAKTEIRDESHFTVDLPELDKIGFVSGTAFYTRTPAGAPSRLNDLAWSTGDELKIGNMRRLSDGWYVLESVAGEGSRSDDYAMRIQAPDQGGAIVAPIRISNAMRNRCGAAVQ
jgi:hypothetical protein